MMKDVFGHGTTTSMLGGPHRSGPEKLSKKKEEPEEHSSVKKHRIQNCGQKKIVFGAPKENEARKASRKAMRAFGRVGFRTSPSEKGSSSDF